MFRIYPLAASLVATFLAVTSTVAQDRTLPREPVLTVRGEGKIEVKPDFARLKVRVVTVGDTLEEAAQTHQDRAKRALDALQDMKSDRFEVLQSSYSLSQDRPSPLPRNTEPLQPKFRAYTNFDLRARGLTSISDIIGRLAGTGVLEVQSVSYGVDRERDALNQARRAAVKDAREQADAYADAAGLNLVEILEVSDGDARTADGMADLPMPLSVQVVPPSVVTFNAYVTITWRISTRS